MPATRLYRRYKKCRDTLREIRRRFGHLDSGLSALIDAGLSPDTDEPPPNTIPENPYTRILGIANKTAVPPANVRAVRAWRLEEIERRLGENEMTTVQLAKELGLAENTIYSDLAFLLDTNRIERRRVAGYFLWRKK